MPEIVPFCAVRPTRDKVGLVASRPYYSYSESQRKARLDSNPYSFLHIMNPGYKFDKEISGKARFQLVKNRYDEFKEEGIFIRDKTPGYYLHKIINRENQVFRGVVGAVALNDYENNSIKKHEATIAHREKTLKENFKTVGFNADPVLLTYPDNTVLKRIFDELGQTRPEYEFTTTYQDTHYLWKINNTETQSKIEDEFAAMDAVYIADGHHRTASSSLLAKEMKEKAPEHFGKEGYNYFMAYALPESDLRIHEFNRLVKDLNGMGKEEFLIKLDTYFRIQNRGHDYYKPTRKGHFTMYLDGNFYALHLRKRNYDFTNALSKLDVQILNETVLRPILGIKDIRHDDRIQYARGKNGMAHIKGLVDEGKFTVGFGMLPLSIEEVKQIADADLILPPKATYFEPKLRSGITIYDFNSPCL